MDINKALGFVRDDPRGKDKFWPGATINMVFIPNFAAWGYTIETLLNVANGTEPPMPEWTNFSGNWRKGLDLFVIRLIYNILTILLFCCGAGAFFFGGASVLGLSTGNQTRELGGALAGLFPIVLFCASCLFILYLFVLVILDPAIVIQYATTGQIGAAFRFGDMFRIISNNLGDYALALIVPWIIPIIIYIPFVCISSILGLIPLLNIIFGIIFGIIGAIIGFVVPFYMEMVRAHLYGQLVRRSAQPPAAF